MEKKAFGRPASLNDKIFTYCQGGIVDGPVSMDIAVNAHAAQIKGYAGCVRGDADILLVPDLEAGNILVKGLMYLCGSVRVAGVAMGARVPLIQTSRGDDHDTKYYSIVLACLISQYTQSSKEKLHDS